MLSTYSKNGLTVNVVRWEGDPKNCYLIAEVIINNLVTQETIEGDQLYYVLKVASELGLKASNGDVQLNQPHKFYAEVYYDIII